MYAKSIIIHSKVSNNYIHLDQCLDNSAQRQTGRELVSPIKSCLASHSNGYSCGILQDHHTFNNVCQEHHPQENKWQLLNLAPQVLKSVMKPSAIRKPSKHYQSPFPIQRPWSIIPKKLTPRFYSMMLNPIFSARSEVYTIIIDSCSM